MDANKSKAADRAAKFVATNENLIQGPAGLEHIKPTPFGEHCHVLTAEEREIMIAAVAKAYAGVLDASKVDWRNDTHGRETPHRFAKMWVGELLAGRFTKEPEIKTFANDSCSTFLIVGPIDVKSMCAHHNLPFAGFGMIGIVTVGEDGKKLPLPGLSKYDRLFGFHARRGHVQENLGHDVLQKLQEETKAHKIAVYINCSHSCVTHRGVGGARNRTATLHMTGAFQQDSALRSEFAGACHYQLGRLQA